MSKVIKSNLLIVHPDCVPVPQGMVVVDKGRVIGVGTEVDVPPNAEVVDCSSYTVMPALIDSHVHITINNRFHLPLSAHFDLDALKAVTTNTAEMLGMADCVGHLGVGMFADVIALDGNPFEDIACLRQVKMVMKEGEVTADVLSGASDIFSD